MKTALTPLFFLAFAAANLAAVSAGAAGQSLAVLQAPLPAPKRGIIDGRLWKCTGVDCSAPLPAELQPIGRECARALRVLGRLAAYSRDGMALDASALAACNRS